MNLTIISSREQKTMSIVWLEVETAEGNFVIQQEHAPTILLPLAHQPITVRLTNGKQEIMTFVNTSVLEVQRTQVTLLVNE